MPLLQPKKKMSPLLQITRNQELRHPNHKLHLQVSNNLPNKQSPKERALRPLQLEEECSPLPLQEKSLLKEESILKTSLEQEWTAVLLDRMLRITSREVQLRAPQSLQCKLLLPLNHPLQGRLKLWHQVAVRNLQRQLRNPRKW